ncbi:MAG: class I SAM-dependent methyltransferase family protein [Candidatus Diapherotrites archaeon]|nr:class I SAM-dependent methyltransferase family protein [Candidatus Diapherotrites archaeon]
MASIPSMCVPKIKAESVKQFLIQNKVFRFGVRPDHSQDFVFFPITQKLSPILLSKLKKSSSKIKQSMHTFPEKEPLQSLNLKDSLKNQLSSEELSHLISAYDIVGSIAVIQVPKELMNRKSLIAKTVLKINHSIQTVCMITGGHSGKYRIQPVKLLAGKKTTETVYKEHNCLFKMDIAKVFFSPRLSFERARINDLIQPNEVIGSFFSGVGPYSIIFAKNSNTQRVYSVELNPSAVKYHKLNNKLNKVEEKVELLKGDVHKIVPKYLKGTCDRIVMPLPETGELFLDEAFAALKPEGGMIHFYTFAPRADLYSHAVSELEKVAKKFNRKIKIVRNEICRTFSASVVQIVLDVSVSEP